MEQYAIYTKVTILKVDFDILIFLDHDNYFLKDVVASFLAICTKITSNCLSSTFNHDKVND